MAHITVSDSEVHIGLSAWESFFGLMRSRTIERAAITDVRLEADPLRATEGIRAPGLGVPGRIKVGTWRGKKRTTFVSVRRAVPAVRIETVGLDRDSFLVSVPNARDVVAALSD